MSRRFREFFFNSTQIASSLSFNFTCEFLMNHKNPISCVYFLLAFVSSQLHCCSISFRLHCRSLWNLPFSRKRPIRDIKKHQQQRSFFLFHFLWLLFLLNDSGSTAQVYTAPRKTNSTRYLWSTETFKFLWFSYISYVDVILLFSA